jgi:hypothetical protein
MMALSVWRGVTAGALASLASPGGRSWLHERIGTAARASSGGDIAVAPYSYLRVDVAFCSLLAAMAVATEVYYNTSGSNGGPCFSLNPAANQLAFFYQATNISISHGRC